jgi:hypothetical protein
MSKNAMRADLSRQMKKQQISTRASRTSAHLGHYLVF